MERWRKWKNDPLLGGLELWKGKGFQRRWWQISKCWRPSLSNAKRLLTEVAVTKYVCWKWYSPNNTIPKSSNMISLSLYLRLIKLCNNCIGKGVAHQVYPPHPHPWAIPSPTHFFWQAVCRQTMWKSENILKTYMTLKKNILGQVHWNPKQSFSIGYKFCFVKLCCIFVMLFWYFCRLHWLEGE